MKNNVLVLIFCGFLICTNLSQDNPVLRFLPNQPSSSETRQWPSQSVSVGDGNFYRSLPINTVDQGYRTPTGFEQEAHIQRQHQVQSGPETFGNLVDRQTGEPSQIQNENSPHVVRVVYHNSPQQGTSDAQQRQRIQNVNNNYGNRVVVRNQQFGEGAKRLIEQLNKSREQKVTFQGPSQIVDQQFAVAPQQQRGYLIISSEQTLRGSAPSNYLRPQQHSLPYSNSVVQSSHPQTQQIEYIQPYVQQNDRTTIQQNERYPVANNAKTSQALTSLEEFTQPYLQQTGGLSKSDREEHIRQNAKVPNPTQTYRKLGASQAQAIQNIGSDIQNTVPISTAVQPVHQGPIQYQDPNRPLLPGQTYSSSFHHQYSAESNHTSHYSYKLSPEGVIQEPMKKEFNHSSERYDFQSLSAYNNPQNSANGKLTAASPDSTKKPFYINTFAADLYITKKPCEICCKIDEIEPCRSCCNATSLLNVRTLKTVLG